MGLSDDLNKLFSALKSYEEPDYKFHVFNDRKNAIAFSKDCELVAMSPMDINVSGEMLTQETDELTLEHVNLIEKKWIVVFKKPQL